MQDVQVTKSLQICCLSRLLRNSVFRRALNGNNFDKRLDLRESTRDIACRTTRPKTNSARANWPNLCFINRQPIPHFRGIEVFNCKIRPFIKYPYPFLSWLTDQAQTSRKLPYLVRGHAVIVNIPHVQMSIRLNSQPNWSEHTYSFYISKDRLY